MIRDAGGEAQFIRADVTKADDIDNAFDAAVKAFGPYNVLFNHAGTIIVKSAFRLPPRGKGNG